MYQNFTIVGNVGREPQLRYTQSGVPVADFSVAVNKRYTTASGEQREETLWVRVTAWRRLAEQVAQYLTKGRQVLVVGEVSVSAYLNNNNEPAATLELTANTVRFLGSREGGQGYDRGEGDYGDFAPPPDDIGDIPF